MKRAIGILIAAAASLGQAPSGQFPPAGSPTVGAHVDRTILMISLDDPGQAHVQQIIQGFQDVLVEVLRPPVLYLEFSDQVRFPQTTYPKEFYQWLGRKYGDRHIDLIVTVQQGTLQMLAEHSNDRWRGLPIVYSSLGDLTIDIGHTLPLATGVVRKNNFPAALRTVTMLLPDTTRIALIYGASRIERERNLWFVSQVAEAGLDVLDLSGLSMNDLLVRVSHLPAGTVPFFLEFQADATGRTFTHSRACELIADAANRPLFGLFRHYFGCGVIGGPLTDFNEVGRLIARQSLKRLATGAVPTVAIPVASYAPLVFDARQLTRWGIPENQLPAGSTVLFRPPSLWRDYRREVIGALAVGALQTVLIVVILLERRRRTLAQRALKDSFLQVQDLAGRLITAQEAERTRIAGELHDDVVQEVAGLSITIGRLAKRTAPGAGEDMQPVLTQLQQRTIGVAEKIRHLSHDLHPGVLQHAGLVAALTSHCAECQRQQVIDVILHADGDFESVSPEAALCLYRVTQEALRNVFTHANARTAVVRLARTDSHAELTVADDGKGFDRGVVRRGVSGLGLLSINERIRLAGGTVDILSEPHTGTTIKVRIPLDEDKAGTISALSGSERASG